MNHSYRSRFGLVTVLVMAGLSGPATAFGAEKPIIKEFFGLDGIQWQAGAGFQSAALVVSGPGGFLWKQSFESDDSLFLDFQSITKDYAPGGQYTYELVLSPRISAADRALAQEARALGQDVDFLARKTLPAHSGTFTVVNGAVLDGDLAEFTMKDIVHPDDVIIQGSLCVGFDCINNENFGFDTIRLKENNLRIHFQDTSVGTFPSRDWRIIINDSASGGASYFAIEDSDAARQILRITAAAPANSLFIDSAGRVGLGTATPVLNLHIASGNTPALRLEQNGSSGFTPQVWDVAANETNFFVRDASNGSKLPFRIQPNAGSNSLFIASTSRVGAGTSAPNASLDVLASSSSIGTGNVVMKLANPNGDVGFQLDPLNNGQFWNVSAINSPDEFRVSRNGTGATELTMKSNGNLLIAGTCIQFGSGGGAQRCTIAGGTLSCAVGACP